MKTKNFLTLILCLSITGLTKCINISDKIAEANFRLINDAYNLSTNIINDLEDNANVNVQEIDNGNTALIIISEMPTADEYSIFNPLIGKDIILKPDHFLFLIKVLLTAKANLDIKNYEGYTALMLATQKGNLKIVQALINAGADLNLKNNLGETALDIANEQAAKDWSSHPISEETKKLYKQNFSFIKRLLELETQRRKRIVTREVGRTPLIPDLKKIVCEYY